MALARARALRRNPTEPERRLWGLLRRLKPLGFHFRRQVPIGRYYADFACHHAELIIEVDGDTHTGDAAIAHDGVRDVFLRGAGYEVLRFSNRDVMHELDAVGRAIEEALKGRATLPTPTLPAGIPPLKGEGPDGLADLRPSPLRGGWRQPGGGRAARVKAPSATRAGHYAFKDTP
jgi:very-short-patch-repair endonuclease